MSDATQQTSQFDRALIRTAVAGYNDAQEVRSAMNNRVRDIVRKKREDIPFDKVEDEKDEDDYAEEYQDDNLADLLEEMRAEGKLTDHENEYLQQMLDTVAVAEDIEDRYEKMFALTKEEPIYEAYLQYVYGVSTTRAAKLLHMFGYAEDFEKVSNMWSYSGLAPGQERERGEKLGYNPDAKTLLWQCADGMIKQGERSLYREHFYDPYKKKQEARMEAVDGIDYEVKRVESDGQTINATFDEDGEMLFHGSPPESQGHADARARRYLMKKFAKHYWYFARDLAGKETPDEYILTHGGHGKRTETFENPVYAQRVLERENS